MRYATSSAICAWAKSRLATALDARTSRLDKLQTVDVTLGKTAHARTNLHVMLAEGYGVRLTRS